MHRVLWTIFFKVTWPLKPDPLVRAEHLLEIMKFEEKFIRIWSRKRIVKKTTVYQQLAIFLPQIFHVPPTLSFYNSPESFSHLPHSWHTAWQCTTNTPCGRPEARIHMRVVQPAVLEVTHLSLPSLLLGRQDKHPYEPVVAQAAAFLYLCCYPLEFQLTTHEEIVRFQRITSLTWVNNVSILQ